MRQPHVRRRGGLLTRVAAVSAIVLGAGVFGACNDFLQADNPGAVESTDLDNARYATLLANGVVGQFQPMFTNVAYWLGQYTDELTNRAVFFEEGLIDQRRVGPENGTWSTFLYNPMQRTRFAADDAVSRLKTILGDSASRDIRVARSLAYGSLTRVYLAEALCAIPIDRSAPQTPDDVFKSAVAQAESAVTIATAFKAAVKARATFTPADTLAADSVRYFALVTAARAALNTNDKAAAAAFARQVPAAFEFRAYFSTNSTGENTRQYLMMTASNSATTANTPFAAMAGDVRIPRLGGTAVTALFPRSGASFSAFDATTTGQPFAQGGFVRISSGLEARYIVAEVEIGTNEAQALALINERRAFGKLQPALAPGALTGAALLAELRDQRRRDFYLDNHRLGDMRRYKRFYNVDEFPKGAYPGSTTGETYDDAAVCLPLTTAEIADNPNIPKT